MSGPETHDQSGVHYHYSRAERLGYDPDAESKKKPESIFKRNRSLVIILLDLAIILIVYAIYLVFLAPDPSTGRIAGYELRLRAVQFGPDVLVTLVVSADTSVPSEYTVNGGAGVLELRILTNEGDELLHVLDTLPAPGEERIFREVFERYSTEQPRIRAVMQIADQELRVHAGIARE